MKYVHALCMSFIRIYISRDKNRNMPQLNVETFCHDIATEFTTSQICDGRFMAGE